MSACINSQQLEDAAVQILSLDENTNLFKLNEVTLERILFNNEIKDLPIAIISIAGLERTGKSLMLNFFLRYLYSKCIKNDETNWLENDEIPKNGFKWCSGIDRQTKGIWIWSKIFVIEIANNKKLGIMLMDTPGMLNDNGKLNNKFFSFSMLMSSVQIYNLMQYIREDDLQYLQLFIGYSELAIERSSRKPFQKLIFLVRDWDCIDENPFGFEGGNNLLNEKLTSVRYNDPTCVRTYLKSRYENIDCFLMPHPGKKVTRLKDFNIKYKDFDVEFLEYLNDLIPNILDPNNLVEKKIIGTTVKARDLLNYFITYWNILKNSKAISSHTIFEASVEANNSTAITEALSYYNDEMKIRINDNKLEVKDMLEAHAIIYRSAIQKFNGIAVIGEEVKRKHYRDNLIILLESRIAFYLIENELKITNNSNDAIDSIIEQLNKIKYYEQSDLIKRLIIHFKSNHKSNKIKKFSKYFLITSAVVISAYLLQSFPPFSYILSYVIKIPTFNYYNAKKNLTDLIAEI